VSAPASRSDGGGGGGAVVTTRKARPSDAEALGIVGPAAYAAAYTYLWDDSAALARQIATFGTAAFVGLLARSEAWVWVAETDGAVIGFLSMIGHVPNPITLETNGAEIPRIYLLPGAQGVGVGRRLLDTAVAAARAEGFSHVWLDVMESALGARRAYARWGFTEIGKKVFPGPVKAGLADMRVLVRRLDER